MPNSQTRIPQARKSEASSRPSTSILALGAGLLISGFTLVASGALDGGSETPDPARTQLIISRHFCPCQCGSHLPGSRRSPACFGCSVGKAEVTFIEEALASGRSEAEVLIALREPGLIEVFADYRDPRLPEIWQLAHAAAAAFAQHRVVLRTPGLDDAAIQAVKVVECGRKSGDFSRWQGHLIAHQGAWNRERLEALAQEHGLRAAELTRCLESIDVSAQIDKDRAHARERGLQRLPAITVNRRPVPATDEALRDALRAVIAAESI